MRLLAGIKHFDTLTLVLYRSHGQPFHPQDAQISMTQAFSQEDTVHELALVTHEGAPCLGGQNDLLRCPASTPPFRQCLATIFSSKRTKSPGALTSWVLQWHKRSPAPQSGHNHSQVITQSDITTFPQALTVNARCYLDPQNTYLPAFHTLCMSCQI